MRMIREVLRLHHSCGVSNKKISKALGCSRGAVAEYRAEAAGLSWPLPDDLDDAQIENRLYPPAGKANCKPQPDCIQMHAELKKKGVTLIRLWSEYRENYPNGYGLTQFCDIYGKFEKSLSIVMRQEHKAGEKAFSAGQTLPITNPHTGEVKPAHLFVCTLGASNFTFADLFWDETVESWCNGHAGAFSYFDGCLKFIIPDKPKACHNQGLSIRAGRQPKLCSNGRLLRRGGHTSTRPEAKRQGEGGSRRQFGYSLDTGGAAQSHIL